MTLVISVHGGWGGEHRQEGGLLLHHYHHYHHYHYHHHHYHHYHHYHHHHHHHRPGPLVSGLPGRQADAGAVQLHDLVGVQINPHLKIMKRNDIVLLSMETFDVFLKEIL